MVNEEKLAKEVEELKARRAAAAKRDEEARAEAEKPREPVFREMECTACQKPFAAQVWEMFGREICVKKCAECMDAETKETERQKLEYENTVANLEWNSLCPPLYRDTDLDRLEIPQKVVLDLLSWEGENPAPALTGTTGRGKTRLMFQLLRKLHFDGHRVYAISAKAFERHCARMFEQDQTSRQAIEKCQSIEILFLDDMGKERMTDRVESELYGLIEDRTANLKPILWTSNADSKSLAGSMSDDRAQPIIRRLKEFSRIISV